MARRRASAWPWVNPFALPGFGSAPFATVARSVAGTQKRVLRAAARQAAPPRGPGHWLPGLAVAPGGLRAYHVYRPPGIVFGERLPVLVMLHGCHQDAKAFAVSTRMNTLAARERFLVLYPEQDRRANAQGCWNWFETRSGQAQREAQIVMAAVQQVCLLQGGDPERVAVAGLSAGASLAALVATRYPERIRAVAMHSGVPPGTASSGATALRAMRGGQLPEGVTDGAHWPPLLVIHGAADAVVSSRNAATTAQWWADAAGGTAAAPRAVQRGQRHPMTVTDYKRGGRTVASLCEVATLGHAWSGGAARRPFSDAKGPDASRLVWSFAARQFAAG